MASSSQRGSENDLKRNTGKFSALYEEGELLGVGAYGKVYKGTRRSDGQVVAIKHIAWDPFDETFLKIPGHDEPLLSEVAINLLLLKPEKCPNIVEMLDWFVEDRTHILILEYPHHCETLARFLGRHKGTLKEEKARHLICQAVNAAKHCIGHKIAHGDLHYRNVIVNKRTLELKLIDFGLSYLIPDTPCRERTEAVVEVVLFVGRLLFKMLTGNEESKFTEQDSLDKPAVKALGLSKECLDLLSRCKLAKEADRPTLEDFLDHEWLKLG